MQDLVPDAVSLGPAPSPRAALSPSEAAQSRQGFYFTHPLQGLLYGFNLLPLLLESLQQETPHLGVGGLAVHHHDGVNLMRGGRN